MKNNSQRIEYVDLAKGLGMLAIIWGHIMVSGWSYVLAYAFDIPLFFFLSGMMTHKSDSFLSFVWRRTKRLLIPYLIFSVLTWIVWIGYNIVLGNNMGSGFLYPLLQTFIAQGSGRYLLHNVPLWFVTCLFVVEILYYFISKLPDIANIIVCIILAVVGHFMLNNNLAFDFTKLPWNFEAAMSAILFYCFGNLFTKHFGKKSIADFCQNKKLIAFVILVISSVIFVFGALWNGHISLGSNQLGNSTIVFYVIGMLGTAAAIILCCLIDTAKENKIISPVLNFLKWIGRNSFYFMAVHVPIKGFIMVIVAKLFKTTSVAVGNNMLLSAISFVPSLLISVIAVIVINWFMATISKKAEKKA